MSIKTLIKAIDTRQEEFLERLVILYLADCVDEASDYVVNLTNLEYLKQWCCATEDELEVVISKLIDKKVLIPTEHEILNGRIYRVEL